MVPGGVEVWGAHQRATAAAILTGPVLLAWAMCSGVSMDWLLTGQQTAPTRECRMRGCRNSAP